MCTCAFVYRLSLKSFYQVNCDYCQVHSAFYLQQLATQNMVSNKLNNFYTSFFSVLVFTRIISTACVKLVLEEAHLHMYIFLNKAVAA